MPEPLDPAARLAAIGRSVPPPPSTTRLAAIETRVLAGSDGAVAEPGDRTARRLVPLALTAAALLLVVVVVAFAGADDRLTLAVADGVTIELPGRAPSPARAGDELPEGAVVEVAPGGVALVGSDRLGPGRYVVTSGGIVPVPVADSTTTSTSAPSTTVPGRPTSTARPTTDAPTVDGSIADRPAPPVATATEPTRVATTSARPDPATTTIPPDRPTTTSITDRSSSTTVVRRDPSPDTDAVTQPTRPPATSTNAPPATSTTAPPATSTTAPPPISTTDRSTTSTTVRDRPRDRP